MEFTNQLNNTQYITQLVRLFGEEDGEALAIIFSKPLVKELLQIQVPLPNDITGITKDIKPILETFISLNKALLSTGDQSLLFEKYYECLQSWNKYASSNGGKENWVMLPLAVVAERLVLCAIKADTKNQNHNHNHRSFETSTEEEEGFMIRAARILDVSKRLCLTDRIEDEEVSKRQYIYFFSGLQFRIYAKLSNVALAKNLEKVLASKSKELPDIKRIPRTHALKYLYYSGVVKLGEGDQKAAWEKFKLAYELSHRSQNPKQTEMILVYLIPLTYLIAKKLPSNETLQNNPHVNILYSDLVQSLKTGDLRRFDRFFRTFESFFLQKTLYIAIESLRQSVLLRLIKCIYLLNNSHPHLNINVISKAIEFSTYGEVRKGGLDDNDETECLIAGLIYKGEIRGYISHGNAVLVLSKKEAFPVILGK